MLGEEINTLTVDEVRERFPGGIMITVVVDGYAFFCGKNDPLKILHHADFRSFLGSITFHFFLNFGLMNERYYSSCQSFKRFNRFNRQLARFQSRKILKLIYRSVYQDKP